MREEAKSDHHFICTGGCHGVSDKPGVCGAKGCAKKGEPLEQCMCPDGAHGGAFEETGGKEDGDDI